MVGPGSGPDLPEGFSLDGHLPPEPRHAPSDLTGVCRLDHSTLDLGRRSVVDRADLSGLDDPFRLDALHSLRLLDSPPKQNLDRLVRLACDLSEAPIGLLTLVDADRQFFLSAHGLPEPLAAVRQTSLDYSLCQYAVASGQPLIVGNTQDDPVLAANLCVRELAVLAYAGIPLIDPQGRAFGTFCVIDFKARDWDDGQLAVLARLAEIACEICVENPQSRGSGKNLPWRRRARKHERLGRDAEPTAAEVEAGIMGEAGALMEGRIVDQLWAQGRRIPPWAWMNALAHRPVGELSNLVGIACNQPGDRWAEALIDIVDHLGQVSGAQAEKIKSELFVPAELEVLAGTNLTDGPSRLVGAVRRHLAGGTGSPPPTPRTVQTKPPTDGR